LCAEGYQCVELMCWPKGAADRRYAGVTHVDVNKLDVDAVLEAAASRKVEISGLGYYPNPLAPDAVEADAAVQHLRRVIEGARKLSVPVVNTFIGGIGRSPCRITGGDFAACGPTWCGLPKTRGENRD